MPDLSDLLGVIALAFAAAPLTASSRPPDGAVVFEIVAGVAPVRR